MLVMPLTDVLAKLEAALVQQPVQRMTARFDWARFRRLTRTWFAIRGFMELMSDAALARGSRSKGSNLRAAHGRIGAGSAARAARARIDGQARADPGRCARRNSTSPRPSTTSAWIR